MKKKVIGEQIQYLNYEDDDSLKQQVHSIYRSQIEYVLELKE